MEAVLLGGTLSTAIAMLAFIELREYGQRQRSWQTVQLRFGRDVTPEAVSAVLDRLSGLPHSSSVALIVQADHDGIKHYLQAEPSTLLTIRAALGALLPSLRFEPLDVALDDATSWRFGRAVRLRGRLRVLQQDSLETTSASLLAAMQPLSEGERLMLRWIIAAGRAEPIPPEPAGQKAMPEYRRLLRVKNDGCVVRAQGLIAASAGHPKRAAHLIARITAVLRTRSTAYGYLRFPSRASWQLRNALTRRHSFLSDRFASGELAGLLAWPVSAPPLPGLSLGTSPMLLPSPRLPRSGRLLGTATWPGAERPIAQPVKGALSHSLFAGPTGVGKSTLLTNLMSADIAAGGGAVLMDGKGDTASALLSRIPPERHGDVVVLDCAAAGKQPGLQLFGAGNPELAADVVLGVLSDLFHHSWGPMSERYLRAGLVTVAHDPNGTLADVPFVFTDAAYRRKLVGRLHDPLTKATLAAFEAMGAAERQHQLAAPLNKLGTLLGRPVVRTVLGQASPRLDFRDVLAKRRIVIISLSPARVGAPAARLIGALSVFALFQAVQGRGALPERARRPFFVYIDEPRSLGDLPMPLDALLEQARGLGVGVTLAPQSVSQLPTSVREAALTNVATRLVWRQHADDARLLARDLPGISAEELGDLAAYEAVARIGLGPGDVAPTVSLKTAPLGKPVTDGVALRKAAVERWGSSLQEVDSELAARHSSPVTEAPLGRRRRSP
jgi:energy-coupling factor transporter ATP-binding protein EcfA2